MTVVRNKSILLKFTCLKTFNRKHQPATHWKPDIIIVAAIKYQTIFKTRYRGIVFAKNKILKCLQYEEDVNSLLFFLVSKVYSPGSATVATKVSGLNTSNGENAPSEVLFKRIVYGGYSWRT